MKNKCEQDFDDFAVVDVLRKRNYNAGPYCTTVVEVIFSIIKKRAAELVPDSVRFFRSVLEIDI